VRETRPPERLHRRLERVALLLGQIEERPSRSGRRATAGGTLRREATDDSAAAWRFEVGTPGAAMKIRRCDSGASGGFASTGPTTSGVEDELRSRSLS
jgi:hypothetical protein